MKIVKLAILVFSINCHAFAYMVCVNSQRANIRSGADIKNEIIWQAFGNTPLEVIAKKGAWYNIVDYAGYTGWIHSGLVSRRRCVIVKTETAYIYSKPEMYSFVEWEVDKEYPFEVLKTQGEWIKVSGYRNAIGWIPFSTIWGI